MIALLCRNESTFIYLVDAGARLDLVGNNTWSNVVLYATWVRPQDAWYVITEAARRVN